MTIHLPPELAQMLRDKVQSGLYLSEGEAVREALYLLDQHDRLRQYQLDDLRKAVAVGLDQLDRGEGRPLDMEEIRIEGRRILAERQAIVESAQPIRVASGEIC